MFGPLMQRPPFSLKHLNMGRNVSNQLPDRSLNLHPFKAELSRKFPWFDALQLYEVA